MHIPRLAAEMQKQAGASREQGVSLPEVLVVLALMSVVALIFNQLYIGTIQTTMFLESHNDLAIFGQQAVNTIKLETMQSRGLFQNDTIGQGYLAALALPTELTAITGSRLPTANANGIFEPDSGTEIFTGNSMLQARQRPPVLTNVDHDGDSSTANVEFLADRYRFQYFYLTKRTDHAVRGVGFRLDLMRFESDDYADYFQLDSLPATFRDAVAADLYAEGVRFAWDAGAAAGSAFYSISDTGAMTAVPDHTIAAAEIESLLPGMGGGRISGAMNYSVGIQKDPPFATKEPVSLFALPSGLFPSGFEVQMIGPTGARKVNMRLMLMAEVRNKLTSHANSVTVTTAEF